MSGFASLVSGPLLPLRPCNWNAVDDDEQATELRRKRSGQMNDDWAKYCMIECVDIHTLDDVRPFWQSRSVAVMHD